MRKFLGLRNLLRLVHLIPALYDAVLLLFGCGAKSSVALKKPTSSDLLFDGELLSMVMFVV
jgi:hypothetical protein